MTHTRVVDVEEVCLVVCVDFGQCLKTTGLPWKTLEDVVEDVYPSHAFPWKTLMRFKN